MRCIVTHWINGRHGIVDEVVLLLLWSHCVAKANVAILLIATVAPSTWKAWKDTWIKRKQEKMAWPKKFQVCQVLTFDRNWHHHSTSPQKLCRWIWLSFVLFLQSCTKENLNFNPSFEVITELWVRNIPSSLPMGGWQVGLGLRRCPVSGRGRLNGPFLSLC